MLINSKEFFERERELLAKWGNLTISERELLELSDIQIKKQWGKPKLKLKI